jgi:hypothetical protein
MFTSLFAIILKALFPKYFAVRQKEFFKEKRIDRSRI